MKFQRKSQIKHRQRARKPTLVLIEFIQTEQLTAKTRGTNSLAKAFGKFSWPLDKEEESKGQRKESKGSWRWRKAREMAEIN